MKPLFHLFVPIAVLSLFCFRSEASIQRKQYQTIDVGCTYGPVDLIYRRGHGHLWIGSQDMVARLTDSGFKPYSPGAGRVRQIHEDSTGNLWVLADSALCRMSGISGKFERFDVAPTAAIPLDDRCIFVSDGVVLEYSGSGMEAVLSFNPSGQFNASEIFKWSDDSVLLVDRQTGALIYDYAEGKVSEFPFIPAGISSVYVDSRQHVWFGKAGEGLTCIDGSGRLLARYTSSESALPGNTVNFIGESRGKIVVLTEAGICRILPDQGGEIIVEEQVTGASSAFPTTDVASMFCADDGSIWFGRRRGGVFVDHNVHLDAIRTDVPNLGSVSCIYSSDPQKKVWVGTSGTGVLVYDPANSSKQGAMTILPRTAGLTVTSMADYSDTELILACAGRGFMLLDKRTGAVRHLETGNLILDSFGRDGSAAVYEVCDGPQGSVMMISGSDMYRYFPASRTFSEIYLPQSVSAESGVFAAFPGETGIYYWDPGALYEYDVLSNSLVEVSRFTDFSVKSASVADDGIIWLGTDKGLASFNRATRNYELIPLPCGCAPETVLCASSGRVWVGSPIALSFYDSSSRMFTKIDTSDGIFPNFYTDKAKYFSEESDEIYIGGVNGFARIDAGISFPVTHAPEIVLESITSYDRTASKAFGSRFGRNYPVTVEIAAKESNVLRDRDYNFIVDGPGKYLEKFRTDLPSLTLSGLSSGTYRVSASCLLKTGGWTDPVEIASFRIAAPWYGSHLFHGMLILLLAAAGARILCKRTKALAGAVHVRTSPAKAESAAEPLAVPFDAAGSEPEYPEVEPREPVADLRNASLLIVEDDVTLRAYIKEELSEFVDNIHVAGNGVEAVEVLKTEDINIVVSDVMMPEMDGFALCKHIKTTVSISHIPVILLTARSDANSRLLGYKNGADDYITKPFDLENLKESIQKLFYGRESMRRRFSGSTPMPSIEETTFSSADEQFLRKFNALVNDNISNHELDTKFLVENMGMSRTVLFNKVKQLTGHNLQSYVNKARMEYVIQLMGSTDLSLGEIAEKAGFNSPRYFSTSFKSYTGMTPSQYKKDKR